jgi:uncharacterized damage-inducible protein DinB
MYIDKLTLDCALIAASEVNDDPALQQRTERFFESLRTIYREHAALTPIFKAGRLEYLRTLREELVSRAKANKRQQERHQNSESLDGINRANKQVSEANTEYLTLRNNPPDPTLTSEAEQKQYGKTLQAALNTFNEAVRKVDEANNAHRGWEQEGRNLQQQYGVIGREIEICDFDRDTLLGTVDPNKRIFDTETGLGIRGMVQGVMRG